MNKKSILHPTFFAAYFVLALLSANLGQIPVEQGILPFLLILVVTTGLYYVFHRLVRDRHRAGLMVTLGLFIFLYYGHVYRLIIKLPALKSLSDHPLVIFVFWAMLLSLWGTSWTWKRMKNPQIITGFLNIVSIVALILPSFFVLDFIVRKLKTPATLAAHLPGVESEEFGFTGEVKPDLYYIILDGYGRADVLEELYNFDNQDFLQFLTERGFFVAGQSHSNYIQTYLSIGSSLNYRYLNDLAPFMGDAWNQELFGELIEHSQVRTVLEEIGYRTVSFSSGFIRTEIRDAGVYLSPYSSPYPGMAMSEFGWFLLSTSAFEIPIEYFNLGEIIPIPGYHTHRTRIQYAFEELAEVQYDFILDK